MSDKTINIIYAKEKRSLINKIKNIGLNKKGIIFGGLVRDEIVATHYREEFYDKLLDKNQYWNNEYHPETSARLLIPNDIDIYFRNSVIVPEFIEDITTFIKLYNGYVYTKNIENSPNFNCFNYVNSYLNLKHTKLTIEIKIGQTISYSGVRLKLDIDVISCDMSAVIDNYSFEKYAGSMEPPFYNLDFHSNIFIMEKINGVVNIRPSNCTGTPLDKMGFTKKTKYINKITEDMINFRTQFVRNFFYSINTEYINCFRIIKMIDRGEFSWNITNIPFSSISFKEIKEEHRCCICLENIDDKQSLISLNFNPKNKNIIHRCCFINYLKTEQRKKYRNADNLIEIRCPFRNPFNFKDCYKNVEYI